MFMEAFDSGGMLAPDITARSAVIFNYVHNDASTVVNSERTDFPG